jgi:hypothetical protein
MTALTVITSPSNDKLFKIEAFLCESWLIVFNKRLKGALQQHGNCVRQCDWQNCDAVDVRGSRMVTSHTSIRVWDSKY